MCFSEIQKISLEEAAKIRPTNADEMWKIVKQSSDLNPIDLKPSTSRKGWKTIRLFVSSTFKDFHQEREVLVKEVLQTVIITLMHKRKTCRLFLKNNFVSVYHCYISIFLVKK